MAYQKYIGSKIKTYSSKVELEFEGVVYNIEPNLIILLNALINGKKSCTDIVGVDINLIDSLDIINDNAADDLNSSIVEVYNSDDKPPETQRKGSLSAVSRNIGQNTYLKDKRQRCTSYSNMPQNRDRKSSASHSSSNPAWMDYNDNLQDFDFEYNLSLFDKEAYSNNRKSSRSKDVVSDSSDSVLITRKPNNPFLKKRDAHQLHQSHNPQHYQSNLSFNQSDFGSHEHIENSSFIPNKHSNNKTSSPTNIPKSHSFNINSNELLGACSSSTGSSNTNKKDIFSEFQFMGIIPTDTHTSNNDHFDNKEKESKSISKSHILTCINTQDLFHKEPQQKTPLTTLFKTSEASKLKRHDISPMITPHNIHQNMEPKNNIHTQLNKNIEESKLKKPERKYVNENNWTWQAPDLIKDATKIPIHKQFDSILNINRPNENFYENFIEFWKIDDNHKVPVLSSRQRQTLLEHFNSCGYPFKYIANSFGKSLASYILRQNMNQRYGKNVNQSEAPKIALIIGQFRNSVNALATAKYLIESKCQILIYCDESYFGDPDNLFDDFIYDLKRLCKNNHISFNGTSCFTYRYEDITNYKFDFIITAMSDGTTDSPPYSPEPALYNWLRNQSATSILAIDPPLVSNIYYHIAVFSFFPYIKPHDQLQVQVKQFGKTGYLIPRKDGVRGLEIDTYYQLHDGAIILCDCAIPSYVYNSIGLEFSNPFSNNAWVNLYHNNLSMVE